MTYITGLVGGIFSAYAQVAETEAAGKVAEYNAKIALQNAEASKRAAEFEAREAENEGLLAREAASIREENVRRAGERAAAEGRQIATAAGLVSSEGSPLLVEMQNVRELEIAALRERYTGDRLSEFAQNEAAKIRYRGELQARAYEHEARLLRYGRRVAAALKYTKATATFLTGGGGAAIADLYNRSQAGGQNPAASQSTPSSASAGRGWYA